MAACLSPACAGLSQSSQEAASANARVQLPVKAQAELDRVGAVLKSAQTRKNSPDAAKALNAMGSVFFGVSDFTKAQVAYEHALLEAQAAAALEEQAAALNGIGGCYRARGEFAKATQTYQQALDLASKPGDARGKATALNGLGWLAADQGQTEKALQYHTEALPLARQAQDEKLTGTILRRTGVVYMYRGENEKALEFYSQALPVQRRAGDRLGEASTLNNFGGVYFHEGEDQKALDYFKQALPIFREVGDRFYTAGTLNNIGGVYTRLGENQKALDSYNQALPILRQVGNRMGEAGTLNNMGGVYFILGENQKAMEAYNQALPILRQVGDRATEATTLMNLGSVYSDLGENQKALEAYNQALPISREAGDRSSEAETLDNMGGVYFHLGEKQKALDSYNQALPLAAFVNDPIIEADIFQNLSRVEKADRPSLAILYGKLEINLVQRVRGNIQGLDAEVQKTFLATNADHYHDLATLLIQEGRLSEAQQVLNFLKAQEYSEYVRGGAGDPLSALSLTPAEQGAEEEYQRSTGRVVEDGRRWSQLKQNRARTAEEDKEFAQLSDSLGKASQQMNEYYARLYKLFSGDGSANRQVASVTDETALLKQQIARMPHTVALYTIVSKDRYSVIVITGPTMVAREYAIADKDLRQKVAAFRQIIMDPTQDPKPLAQELYRILIGPVKADLEQAKAETLIWSLDGVLRYLPFAALYDGQHYLVEEYSQASFTPVSIPHLSEKPDLSSMNAVAMGISGKFDEQLQPLPQVESELDRIVRDPQVQGATGVLPGTMLLNDKFTTSSMEKQLDGQHAIVHIASHFVLRPGDDSRSYLLLAGGQGGAGHHMTVADFRDDPKMSLEGTELLALSACDTGVGGSSANGREVDGLATTAQRKGAKAVISSLWQLNDNSTADLMADFYQRWVGDGGKVTKVEALRQAQLDLLRGKGASRPGGSDPDAGRSYAQPYYWAPFVLMGNWQ